MKPKLLLLFVVYLFSCTPEEQVVTVEPEVYLHIKADDHTAPLQVKIENKTRNALMFHWIFEGGIPCESSNQYPPVVTYETPGDYKVLLEAWNDGHRVTEHFMVHVDSAVAADFSIQPEINNYAPVIYRITNLSSGGNTYQWTFEGGSPEIFSGKYPPPITYEKEGNYSVSLHINNGSADFSITKEIEVLPVLEATFDIIPSFEDEDLEAPLWARLSVHMQGATSVFWSCEGGSIEDRSLADTRIFFSSPGVYMVNLNVGNGKNTKSVAKQLVVKPNSNLRHHKDIRFGINTAGADIGYYYSTRWRRSLNVSELNQLPATDIDIVFFGLDKNFSWCKFVSPDSCSYYPLVEIPESAYTQFVHQQSLLSPDDFRQMNNDNFLKSIEIENTAGAWDGFLWNTKDTFANEGKVILFRTSDNRKGAILVHKAVAAETNNSYIIADIKIQKNE